MEQIELIQGDVNELSREDPTLFNLYQVKLQNVASRRVIAQLEAMVETLKIKVGELEAGAQKTNGLAKDVPSIAEKKGQ